MCVYKFRLTTRYFFSLQRQYNAADFKISSDLKYVLLITEVEPTNIYTSVAKYYIYERLTRYVSDVREKNYWNAQLKRLIYNFFVLLFFRIKRPLSHIERDQTAPYLQYATWSPDGVAIAFIHDNDIYYKPKVQKDLVCRITKSGRADIYNGVPDWLYESEILKTSHTLWFSPDGMYLLYLTFNDSMVEEYKYTWYDASNVNTKYPRIRSVRYPKVSFWFYFVTNFSFA